MSVLGTSTQVAPGNYLFSPAPSTDAPSAVGSPLLLIHSGANAQIRPADALTGTLFLGSSAAAPGTVAVSQALGPSANQSGVQLASAYSNNSAELYTGPAGTSLSSSGVSAVNLGSHAYPSILTVSPVAGTTPGQAITANADINLGTAGGKSVNINNYGTYLSAGIVAPTQSTTPVPDPAGIPDGVYLVMTLASATTGTNGGISAICIRQLGGWTAGGGAQVYAGGDSTSINVSDSGVLNITNYTASNFATTLFYIRICSTVFNAGG